MKRRRGAMLALVGIVMVAMLSLLAVVVDMSRMYTQKNELQTVADAAALAGLLQLYKDVYYVDDSVIAHGARNEVQKQTITIAGSDVICGVWVDDTDPQTFTPNPNGNCAITDNAVSVTAKAAALSAMPGILDVGNKQLVVNAIAWGAFVDASDCVKPFGMQHQILTKLLQPGNPDTFRTLTALDLEKLRTLPIADLTFQLKYGSAQSPGNFGAIEMENPNAGGGGAEYKLNIAKCNPTKFARGQI
ncbi:MAG: pilus assembly protein TadG-related protein, partial [Gemmatimonadota bacterium]|nr:pilus assembly protein TadG-related protein [Gemmatimonadota bacterium]